MKTILNLTQHSATSQQIAAGVVDTPEYMQERLAELLTFNSLPSSSVLEAAARSVAELATEYFREFAKQEDFTKAQKAAFDLDLYAPGLHSFNNISMATVMVGGAPFFMRYLEEALEAAKIRPVYAFSVRDSEEQKQADGSLKKTTVFNHLGFVEA